MQTTEAEGILSPLLVEHPAVCQPALYLQEQGFEVTYLPVDSRGVVQMDALRAVLREDTILVSVMYVNNEVGAVMPVEEMGSPCSRKESEGSVSCRCGTGIWKVQNLPEKNGNRSCCLSAAIRSTGQRAWDFFILMKRQKSSRRFLAEDSRAECVPEQTMYRELQDWHCR